MPPVVETPWVEPPSLRTPALVSRVLATPLRLWSVRDLAAASLARELRGRVAGTVLGPLWPLAQPLTLLVVYGFVFTTLLAQRLPGADGGTAWGAYMLVGTLAWTGLAESLTRSTSALVEGRELVRKLAYPIELLPLVPALASIVLLTAGAVMVVALGWATGLIPISPGLWALPLLAGLQAAFAVGLGWALAGLNACLRDVGQLLPLVLTAAMLATPVFWVASAELVPGLAPFLPYVEASPLTHVVDGWRAVLLGGLEGVPAPAPTEALAALAPWSCGALLLGRLVLARLEPLVLDEV